MTYEEYIMRGISNILWHIRVNQVTIEEVEVSLKSMLDEYNRTTGKNIK
jgi:hypothetical protein